MGEACKELVCQRGECFMDFEKLFEDFMMEAAAYGAWGRLERADSYLYRFYDVAITFAPSVPLRKSFEELLLMRDNQETSSIVDCEKQAELENKFIYELRKTLEYLASASHTEKPAA